MNPLAVLHFTSSLIDFITNNHPVGPRCLHYRAMTAIECVSVSLCVCVWFGDQEDWWGVRSCFPLGQLNLCGVRGHNVNYRLSALEAQLAFHRVGRIGLCECTVMR